MRATQKREEVTARIRTASRKLYLSGAVGDLCEKGGTFQQVQFMLEALEQEIRIREANKKSRLLRRACFPVMKSFEGYDYGDIQLPPALGRQELEDAAFVEEKENLVLYGPVGTGKTHMAIAAGIRACNKGYRVRFYTVTELVLALSASKREGTLDKLQK